MKLRKYTKIFKNRASATKFRNRMSDYAGRHDYDIEHWSQTQLTFDDSARRRRARYTVIYYMSKYDKEQKVSRDDLYGSSAKDATAKFRKAFGDAFKDHTLVIRNVKFKSGSGNLKLYTFSYYLKKR